MGGWVEIAINATRTPKKLTSPGRIIITGENTQSIFFSVLLVERDQSVMITNGNEKMLSIEEENQSPTATLLPWNGYLVPSTCSLDRDLLAIRNPHLRDEAVAFDEGPHRYWVHGQCWEQSITGAISDMFPAFDAKGIADKMVRGASFAACRGDKAKYKPIVDRWAAEELSLEAVRDAVLEFWTLSNAEASRLGTEMHAAIEDHYNAEEAERTPPEDVEERESHARTLERQVIAVPVRVRVEFEKQFKDYAALVAQRGWVAYRTEMRVFCERSRLVGSVDMIFQDTATKEYHLRDWKRSKKISTRAFRREDRGFHAFQDIEACNHNKYSLQLGVYARILRQHYGIDCKSAALVVFHPNQATFQEYRATPYTGEIEEFFASRSNAQTATSTSMEK